MTVLSRRTKNNPILIGEPGVGKTAIAEGLAQRMGTSLSTVRRMEDGNPGTALHTFLRALHVLGRLDDMVKVMALDQDTLALELARERLPQRVRSATGNRAKIRSVGTSGKGRETVGDDDELEGF